MLADQFYTFGDIFIVIRLARLSSMCFYENVVNSTSLILLNLAK